MYTTTEAKHETDGRGTDLDIRGETSGSRSIGGRADKEDRDVTEPNRAEARPNETRLRWDVVSRVGHGDELSSSSTLQARSCVRVLRRAVHAFPQ